eukprot:3907912-Rhodomonas_salina.1
MTRTALTNTCNAKVSYHPEPRVQLQVDHSAADSELGGSDVSPARFWGEQEVDGRECGREVAAGGRWSRQ